MIDTRGYGLPVHRSLLQREMALGVPQAGMVLLVLLGVIFIYGLELYFMGVPIMIFYFVMRALSKRDPYLVDIVLEHIGQKDVLLP